MSWTLGVIATGALSWSIHSFSALEDGIAELAVEVTRLTTQMQVNSQRMQEQQRVMERIEERLRAVERVR